VVVERERERAHLSWREREEKASSRREEGEGLMTPPPPPPLPPSQGSAGEDLPPVLLVGVIQQGEGR